MAKIKLNKQDRKALAGREISIYPAEFSARESRTRPGMYVAINLHTGTPISKPGHAYNRDSYNDSFFNSPGMAIEAANFWREAQEMNRFGGK